MAVSKNKKVKTMVTVFDVAAYILKRQGSMSAWKLQKLCYYSQAWSLTWTEHELFPEEFEAWSNGAGCRELFYKHKGLFMGRVLICMMTIPIILILTSRIQ